MCPEKTSAALPISILFPAFLSCTGVFGGCLRSSTATIPPGTPPARIWKSGPHHLSVDGLERRFLLDVPGGLKPGAPLVLVFHGFGGSAEDVRRFSGFTPVSEKNGFVVAYPEGTRDSKGKPFFNVGYEFHRDQKVDDVRFAQVLAERLVRDLTLDERAVFSTGFSNGGDMSYLLGSQEKPFVAAIAPVAGTMMADWPVVHRTPERLSLLAINMTDDKTTLWAGDPQNRDGWGSYLGTEAVMEFWVKGLRLERIEQNEVPGPIRLHRWTTRRDACEARLYEISTGGHHWPPHLDDKGLTTAATIWRFFDSHRRDAHP